MADVLPDPPPFEGQRWSNRRLDYEQHQVLYESYIDSLEAEGIVTDGRLSFRDSMSQSGRLVQVNLSGFLVTASGARVFVNEWLDIVHERGRPTVQTREYDYHARLVVGPGRGQDLFRFDNSHGDLDTLHKHFFDVDGREYENRPITLEEMPGLSQVIREAEFYASYLRQLRGS